MEVYSVMLFSVWSEDFEYLRENGNRKGREGQSQVATDVCEKGERECNGKKCRDGEECGTLSLGDRPGQLRGWNVPEKYVAYSWRTGNKALSRSLHLSSLHSQSSLLRFSCLSFYLSLWLYVPPTPTPSFLGLWVFFLHLFLQLKLIPFSLSCLGNSHSMVVFHHSDWWQLNVVQSAIWAVKLKFKNLFQNPFLSLYSSQIGHTVTI